MQDRLLNGRRIGHVSSKVVYATKHNERVRPVKFLISDNIHKQIVVFEATCNHSLIIDVNRHVKLYLGYLFKTCDKADTRSQGYLGQLCIQFDVQYWTWGADELLDI